MGVLGGYSAESVAAADRLGGLNQNPNSPYHNDQYDAFRHAYTSAQFSLKASNQPIVHLYRRRRSRRLNRKAEFFW